MGIDKRVTYSDDDLFEASMDASKMAGLSLDEVLGEESLEDIIEHELSYTSVDEERRAQKIIDPDSGRTMSRVLFVTTQREYLEVESASIQSMLSLAAYFDEVHIIVLAQLGKKKERQNRVADNLWVYQADATHWWKLPWEGLDKADEQLSFTENFRADIIVALDPFESGLAARMIAKKHGRALQVHVSENFMSEHFLKAQKGNKWRRRLAKYILKRTPSIRTSSSGIEEMVRKLVKKKSDVRVLPQFYNFKEILRAKPTFDVHERYKDFVFVMLAFGEMTADSKLHDTFSALNIVLHNPRIGLVVIGDGPAKHLFEEKVELLGIKKNVVFLSRTNELASFLKTADVMIETRTSKESEKQVLQAAAAGLPLIMYETELRNSLFKDGESASIVESGDIRSLTKRTNDFLNNQAMRIQYKSASQHIVSSRLVEDETTYYRAFRDSIEVALFAGTEHEEVGEIEKETDEKK